MKFHLNEFRSLSGIQTIPRQKANKPCSIFNLIFKRYDFPSLLSCLVCRKFRLNKLLLELKYGQCFYARSRKVATPFFRDERDNDRWAGVNISLPDFTLRFFALFRALKLVSNDLIETLKTLKHNGKTKLNLATPAHLISG